MSKLNREKEQTKLKQGDDEAVGVVRHSEVSAIVKLDEDLHLDNIEGDDLLAALQTEDRNTLISALKYDGKDPRSRREQARDAMLTLEIAKQDGVKIKGDVVSVPGRISLTMHSLIQTLLAVMTLCTTFVHFIVFQKNFILTVFVVFIIQIGIILVYHTAYCARRTGIRLFQLIMSFIFTALVDWGYIDQIVHLPKPEIPCTLLVIGLVAFNLIPLNALAHFLFFGRGTRTIILKR